MATSHLAPTPRDLLRHTVATLAYRAGKAIRNAPPGFSAYRASEKSRTPLEILAHMGDLLDWALSLAKGDQQWNPGSPASWEQACERFFAGLNSLDGYLASHEPAAPPEKLFQGPIADALTHVGQLTFIRRIAGNSIKGENYFRAEIVIGRVGEDQAPPKREFD